MRKILKNIAGIVAVFMVLVTFTNCESENFDATDKEASVTNVKNWFEKNKPNLTVLSYTKTVDWDNAIVTDGKGVEIIEVPLLLKDNIAVRGNDKSLKVHNRLLIVANEKGSYEAYQMLITTKKEAVTDEELNKRTADFYEHVTVLDSKNQVVDFDPITGKAIPLANNKTAKAEESCTWLIEMYDDGSIRYVDLLFCQSGGTLGSQVGGGGGGGDQRDLTVTQIIEEQIDGSKLTPCLKAILEQLKNASNSDIVSILEKLGASTSYNVTMQMGAMANPWDYAETVRTSRNNYSITVTLDTYTGATKLFRAQSLLHELTHAYFISLVDDYNTYPTNAPFADFPALYQGYVDKNFPGGVTAAQHETMANKYVDAIATALQEYDANYTVPYQVYTDLAWFGLKDTPTFKTKFPEGSANYIRMENRYGCEQTGRTVESGTPNEQSPVGKPCN